MAYLDQAGLVARFGEAEILRIADRDNDKAIDADVVAAALDDASEEIDSYVGTRYSVPISPPPALLARLCGDIARFILYGSRMLDEVRNRYDNAIRLLKDISAGKASLAVAAEDLPPPAGGVLVSHDETDRTFTRDSLCGF